MPWKMFELSMFGSSFMGALKNVLIGFVAIPVVMLFMGGILWFPIIALTKEREPWTSLLLACSLGVTVFGVGLSFSVPLILLASVIFVGLIALGLMRLTFGLGRLERYGIVHGLVLVATISSVAVNSVATR